MINLVSVSHVFAQSFKIDTRTEDTKIILNVQNPPAGTTTINLYRDGTGFVLKNSAGTALSRNADGSFTVQAGTSYTDDSISAGNTYNYEARAMSGTNQLASIVTSVPYKVVGNTGTYRPLFQTNNFPQFVDSLVTWVAYRIGPGVVGLMILYAGFRYIASQGNEAEVKESKERIVGSLLGLVLLMLIGTIMRILLPID